MKTERRRTSRAVLTRRRGQLIRLGKENVESERKWGDAQRPKDPLPLPRRRADPIPSSETMCRVKAYTVQSAAPDKVKIAPAASAI